MTTMEMAWPFWCLDIDMEEIMTAVGACVKMDSMTMDSILDAL
jgi:hypothetical protein